MSQHVDDLKSSLKGSLPTIGSQLIVSHVDMTHPANQSFAANPNDPSEHAPTWHQFGIVEHSIKFQESMEGSVLDYVRAWGLIDSVEEELSKDIDGVSKRELLTITSLLHDIGKFTGRKVEEKNDGSISASFEDHEAESGRLVRQEPIYSYLETHGLTVSQIEYIAHTAELHFELGKLRRVAKTTEVGYTMKFVDTPECQEAIDQIIEEHRDFALEIGLQFIADAMSKTE